ncbi:MAG TPA: 5,6-dimethylbenzimidazole synthase [Candidatus Angelobacter sp.]|nr:5,6-dimethylbenzimidazole synthase [Candidatus Angelobacter sp.]
MQSSPPIFDQQFHESLTDLIRWRRDVRRFRRDPIQPELLADLLKLASWSPSVGYSQPWRFVLVQDAGRRAAIRANFLECNQAAQNGYSSEKAQRYAQLKLAGLDEAPTHIAVFCDMETEIGHGLGRKTMPEMLEYSVAIACHTLWLAARARGLGLGWVSILEPNGVKKILEVPCPWKLIAYLCIGFPEEEHVDPELARHEWEEYHTPEVLIR